MKLRFLLLSFCFCFSIGCAEKDAKLIEAKVRGEMWRIDPKDASIYRGSEFIYASDQSAKDFVCFHKEDIKFVLKQNNMSEIPVD